MGKTGRLIGGDIVVNTNSDDFAANPHTGFLVAMSTGHDEGFAGCAGGDQPARWQGATGGEYVTWSFPGSRADLYLMPAALLEDAAGAYARLSISPHSSHE